MGISVSHRRNSRLRRLPLRSRRGRLSLEPLEQRLALAASFVPGELLVSFRPGVGDGEAQDLYRAHGMAELRDLDWNRGDADLGLKLVSAAPDKTEALIQILRHDPRVEYAEPNWLYTHQAVSNDPYYTNGSLWGMYGDGTTPANQYGSQAGEAWAAGHIGSNTVYVGVIDEGIQFTHPDLAANVWTNSFDPADGVDNDGNGYVDDIHGWDFAGNNNTIYDGTGDDHGTHVTGTIAAKGGNGAGVAGVNWNVIYISAKFLGTFGGTTANAVKAVDYFTDLKTRHGLNIVATNNSWGGGGYSQALFDAINRAAVANILFVAAAGNGGSDQVGDNNDTTASYPSNYNIDNVIAVAALQSNGTLASYSNYGLTTVDLAAPGSGIYSTVPSNSYASYSGTSMATPHVTGAAALYASTHPLASALEIRNAILASTTPTASLTGKTVTGGRLNVGDLMGPANNPPVAANDDYSVAEDVALSVAAPGVLFNDSDPDGDPITAVLATAPVNGAVTLNADASFTYTPNANFNGTDNFTYKAYDGTSYSNAATVSITVTAVNDAPVASNDSYAATEGTVLTVAAPGVLSNDSDVDGNPITAVLVATPVNGTVALNDDGSFTYTPGSGFKGTDSFTYKANDGTLDSNVATVSITVSKLNHPPVAVNDSYVTNEDAALNAAAPGVLFNDSDEDLDPITAVLVAGPFNGSLTFNADGSFNYTPNANFNGMDTFTYKAIDGVSDSNEATVSITVNAVNDAPVAVGDSYATKEGTSLVVTGPGVLGNDSDVESNPITAVWVAGPTNGTLTLNSDGSFTYTPNAGFKGDDSFSYKANDGTIDSNVATVSITVTPAVALYFSLGSDDSNNVLGLIGDYSRNEDVIAFDGSSNFSLNFDGSDVGLSAFTLDAFTIISATEILMSFTEPGSIPNISGTVDDSDLVKFTATSLGATTAGTFALYFDGSDAGLTSDNEDVDAIELLADGRLVISTTGSFNVPGASGEDEDLAAFTPTSLGTTTAGSWSLYFDGSDVGLSSSSSEDVDAVAVDGAGKIYLSTVGDFSVNGVSGRDEGVFVFTPSSLGSTTKGSYDATLFFDGSLFGLGDNDIFAIDLPSISSSSSTLAASGQQDSLNAGAALQTAAPTGPSSDASAQRSSTAGVLSADLVDYAMAYLDMEQSDEGVLNEVALGRLTPQRKTAR